MKSLHLTDQQIAELLDNTAGAITQQHLLRCAHCQSEVAGLRASIANFRAAATAMAAAETPALERRPAPAPAATPAFRRTAWAASLATAAAMLALSVSLIHPAHPVHDGVTPETTAPANVAAESDEALLDGIQQDLSTSIPPSLQPLAVPASQN